MRRLLFALLGLLASASAAVAGVCSAYPYTLQNGQTADASQVMADFNLIRNCALNSLAASGVNGDITQLTGITTPVSPAQGGTSLYYGSTSTGSANAQVVATTVPNSFTLTQGFAVTFIAGFSNTGATTLNVSSSGVLAVDKRSAGGLAALAAGDLISGLQYVAIYDGSVYELINPSSVVIGPAGAGGSSNGNVPTWNGTTGTLLNNGFALGTAANNIVQLDGSAKYPSADGSNITNLVFTKQFASGLFAIQSGGTIATLAHGLPAAPALIIMRMKCTIADQGWSPGDIIEASVGSSTATAGGLGFQVWSDATNIYVLFGAAGINILNKSTGVSAMINGANWQLVVNAYE